MARSLARLAVQIQSTVDQRVESGARPCEIGTEQLSHVGSPEQRLALIFAPAPAKARQSDSIRTERSSLEGFPACTCSLQFFTTHQSQTLRLSEASAVTRWGHDAARSALLTSRP